VTDLHKLGQVCGNDKGSRIKGARIFAEHFIETLPDRNVSIFKLPRVVNK
jgi:hypothetical protein